jgi:fructose-1,6-bisphosphatase/inositol monophosphatase family enzyme
MQRLFGSIYKKTRRLILHGMPATRIGINTKGDVTKYFDKHTENVIISELKKHVKFKARIISEELKKPIIINPDKTDMRRAQRVSTGRTRRTQCVSTEKPMHYIIIDPVDGSDNYLARVPFVAIAIAVFDEKLQPVYSLAGNYYTGDFIYADREAAYFNGRRIRKPFIKPPKDLLILTVSKTKTKKPEKFMELANKFNIVRSFGATAGEMLLVVKGEAKAFVDVRGSLTLENFAPYFLIAKHAGLRMTDENGREMKLKSLSMKKGYKMVFAQPAFLKKIVKLTALM